MATGKITGRIETGQYIRLLWCAFYCCSLLFAACSKDSVIEDIKTGTPIRFAGSVSTKASITTLASLDKIGVFGYYTGTERWEWSAANIPGNLKPDYFLNEPVEKSGSTWGYDADYPRYWPSDARNKVSFFAYAPYDGTGPEDISSVGLYPAVIAETGTPKLTYTVPADVTGQIDLLQGACLDRDKNDNGGTVLFNMNHALTKISFSAMLGTSLSGSNNTIEIKEITIDGVYNAGALDLATGKWTLNATTDNFTLGTGHLKNALFDSKVASDYDSRLVIEDDCYLMMMPQQMTKNSILSVTFEINTVNTSSATRTEGLLMHFPLLDANIKSTWEPGKSIEYNFTLKHGVVDFDIYVLPWEDEVLPSILH